RPSPQRQQRGALTMSKKRRIQAKRLALRAAPLLLTEVRSAEWSGGVLFIDVDSGPEAGTLALGPNAVCQLMQFVGASMRGDVSPLARNRAQSPAEKEAKP